MSLYRKLAQLRPMMPFPALSDIIGSEWKPGNDGAMTVNGCFSVRIDVTGTIGSVRFNPGFPERIEVEGLRIKMPLERVLSARLFDFKGQNQFKTQDIYACDAGQNNQLLAYVSPADQNLHSFEIVRPGLSYPTATRLFQSTMIVLSEANYTDSAEMLRDWVENHASASPGDEAELYAQWLSAATSDDWDRAACHWNWDYGLVPMFWIIRQPNCEKATALRLFYASMQQDFIDAVLKGAKAPKLHQEKFELFSEIRERLMAGFYTRATVAFDAAEAFRQAFGEAPKDAGVFSVVPETLRQPIAGRMLPDMSMAFADGFPDAMWR